MSLAEATKRKAVEMFLINPLEAIWTPKWVDEAQRLAFIAQLVNHLESCDEDKLRETFKSVVKYHSLARFPTIAHILKAVSKESGESWRSGKLSGEEIELNRQWMKARGYLV